MLYKIRWASPLPSITIVILGHYNISDSIDSVSFHSRSTSFVYYRLHYGVSADGPVDLRADQLLSLVVANASSGRALQPGCLRQHMLIAVLP